MVDLVEDDKGGHEPIKDAKLALNTDGGILNQSEGVGGAEYPIDKPNSLRMRPHRKETIKDANVVKDARVPIVGEGGTLNEDGGKTINNANAGTLKECAHGYPDGKGCYLCDSDHPYRKAGGTV
jgi:hypothetical protein